MRGGGEGRWENEMWGRGGGGREGEVGERGYRTGNSSVVVHCNGVDDWGVVQ